jgi:hypothetical protein
VCDVNQVEGCFRILIFSDATPCGRVNVSYWFEGFYHSEVISTSALYVGGPGLKSWYGHFCPE